VCKTLASIPGVIVAFHVGYHARRVAAGSAASGQRQRQLVFSSNTVDPNIDVSEMDIHSGVKFCAGLGNLFRFQGRPSPTCRPGFLTHGAVGIIRGGVQRVNHVKVWPSNRPASSIEKP
jgi:hypothetical protein